MCLPEHREKRRLGALGEAPGLVTSRAPGIVAHALPRGVNHGQSPDGND